VNSVEPSNAQPNGKRIKTNYENTRVKPFTREINGANLSDSFINHHEGHEEHKAFFFFIFVFFVVKILFGSGLSRLVDNRKAHITRLQTGTCLSRLWKIHASVSFTPDSPSKKVKNLVDPVITG